MRERAGTVQRQAAYTWRPLTPDTWHDLEALFGPNGAYSGCWCMSFRLPRAEWMAGRANGGAGNREALHALTVTSDVPGILAYAGDAPAGWCAIAPRVVFPALERSPYTRQPDATPVWSIACFYVPTKHRRRGVMAFLVRAAIEYVRERGGGVIEAYPRREAKSFNAANGWTGLLPVFIAAGFGEVTSASGKDAPRAVVRYDARQ